MFVMFILFYDYWDATLVTFLLNMQMTSTKPYLRKKAILIMYKVFLKFPEALRPAFPRLKEKLEDPDPGKSIRD